MPTQETLQTWLDEAEVALHARLTGQQATSISHSNDAGSRSVGYANMSVAELRRYITDLKRQLGQMSPRHPIQVCNY